jgi:succinate dehydrogenase / fumarate reductase iron-sulfur subunit
MSEQFKVTVLRQEHPDGGSHWETFEVEREPGLNVTTVLQRIAANPVTVENKPTTPVAYDACCLEEVCGACTMIINGRVRQACSALVDKLLKDRAGTLELRPMTKFPVVRDLLVDRKPMFAALKRLRAWVPVDGYHDLGPGPRVSPAEQDEAYPLSRCMTCGCCMEVCPQYNTASAFIGPAPISQAVLFNEHPVGRVLAADRLEALSGSGGVVDCGNSQNCVKVCPKDIPLTTSIAQAGRDTTVYKIKKWLGR